MITSKNQLNKQNPRGVLEIYDDATARSRLG